MAGTSNTIRHEAFIHNLDEENYFVRVIVKSACSACHAKTACSISEISEKIIEVKRKDNRFKTGDKVVISMKSSLGFKALFLGYILPFILLVSSLIFAISAIHNEGIAAMISLAIVGIYYTILYYFRESIKKIFTYQLESYTSNAYDLM